MVMLARHGNDKNNMKYFFEVFMVMRPRHGNGKNNKAPLQYPFS